MTILDFLWGGYYSRLPMGWRVISHIYKYMMFQTWISHVKRLNGRSRMSHHTGVYHSCTSEWVKPHISNERVTSQMSNEWRSIHERNMSHIWIKKHVTYMNKETCHIYQYGVATISSLLKIIGLFCKRALLKRRYSAIETYNFKEPTNRSHPIGSLE